MKCASDVDWEDESEDMFCVACLSKASGFQRDEVEATAGQP